MLRSTMYFNTVRTCYLLVITLLCISLDVHCDSIIRIKNGLVKGFPKRTYYGKEYISFEGIRYGQPPENELRYRNPLPAKNWKGVYIANESIQCAQFYPYTSSPLGQEDCLTLNVYVPSSRISESDNLDVIIFFATGGYYFSAVFGPDIILERDVVFVTFNHRLNYLGFMSFGDKLVPGNFGMKDQVLMLKWTKENIRYFGGNPNSVTLMGMGGGSSSVQYHYLSPLSKGLFHKAFIISGSALNPYAFHSNPTRGLSDYVREMDCERSTNQEVLKCLQEADLQKTLRISFKINEEHSPRASTIHVEPKQDGAFLLDGPGKLFREGKVHQVPQVIMMSLEEGLLVSGFMFNRTEMLNEQYKELFPKYFQYSDVKAKDNTSERIKEYLGTITQENYRKFTDLLSLRLFGDGLEWSAKYLAKALKRECYFGVMSYKGANSMIGSVAKGYFDLGVGHGDILPLFVTSPDYERLTGEDAEMSKLLVNALVDFAKTGTAKIDGKSWTPVSKLNDNEVKYVNFKSSKQYRVESKNIESDRELLSSLHLNHQ